MRPIKKITRIIIPLFAFILLGQVNVLSQGTDINIDRHSHFFIGFSIGPSQTNILNTGSLSISDLVSSKKNSFYGSFDIGYMFSRNFGLSTGFGISSYVTELSLNSYTNSYDTIDSELETYNRRIVGEDINEIQKILFLDIPVLINFQVPFSNSFGIFIKTGINVSIPVSNKYSSSGTFSYTGYYPAYEVIMTDIPYEGFSSNVRSDESGELKIKAIVPEFISTAGLYLNVKNNWQVALGGFYNKMLSDISGYSSDPDFNLTSIENQNNSLMEGSDKVSVNSMGLKISFRFFLQK